MGCSKVLQGRCEQLDFQMWPSVPLVSVLMPFTGPELKDLNEHALEWFPPRVTQQPVEGLSPEDGTLGAGFPSLQRLCSSHRGHPEPRMEGTLSSEVL